jgi:hypothetical protein
MTHGQCAMHCGAVGRKVRVSAHDCGAHTSKPYEAMRKVLVGHQPPDSVQPFSGNLQRGDFRVARTRAQARDSFPPDGHARQMAASAVSVKVLQHAEQLADAELVRRRLQRATAERRTKASRCARGPLLRMAYGSRRRASRRDRASAVRKVPQA